MNKLVYLLLLAPVFIVRLMEPMKLTLNGLFAEGSLRWVVLDAGTDRLVLLWFCLGALLMLPLWCVEWVRANPVGGEDKQKVEVAGKRAEPSLKEFAERFKAAGVKSALVLDIPKVEVHNPQASNGEITVINGQKYYIRPVEPKPLPLQVNPADLKLLEALKAWRESQA